MWSVTVYNNADFELVYNINKHNTDSSLYHKTASRIGRKQNLQIICSTQFAVNLNRNKYFDSSFRTSRDMTDTLHFFTSLLEHVLCVQRLPADVQQRADH